MCTAISYIAGRHYFGRNLDLEYHYSESVTITPRNFPFSFRENESIMKHHAIIGIATIVDAYPLYYDAANEFGLCMAALNFPGNAVYNDIDNTKTNIAAFELIPYILSRYKTVNEVKDALYDINIINASFNYALPVTPLHWFVADKNQTITLEQTSTGLHIYDNPIKVLTNNPPFPYHMENLSNYLNITADEPSNRFLPVLDLKPYSRGMGALGLPGDLSSASRFVKAAFVLHHSLQNIENAVGQFFHILSAVEQQEGCVHVGDGLEKTVYSSCCDTEDLIYYYTTYENRQITAIKLRTHNLNGTEIVSYPLKFQQQIFWGN